MDCGTTTTGYCAMSTGSAMVIPGLADMDFRWRATLTALSTVGEEYSAIIGLHDALAGTTLNATDGVYFRYHRLVDGDFWACCTANNSDADPTSPTNFTKTVTTVAPVISSAAFQEFRILITEAGTKVRFYIDDVLVATHTTNIPAARNTGFGARILKSAGTTAREFINDYCDCYIDAPLSAR